MSLRRLVTAVAVMTSVALTPRPDRPLDDYSILLMASEANWTDSSFTGHAFVCLQLRVNSGLKEDCYGFYPRKGMRALVGGPGVVDSEFDFEKHPPTRFSNVKVSLNKTISLDARRKILSLIRGYDKNFSLVSNNCVSFANSVARLAGLVTPDGVDFLTPVAYVQKLRALNPGT